MINRYLIWLEVLWFWSNVFLSWLKVFLIWLKMFLDLIESVPWFDWKCSLIWLNVFFDLIENVPWFDWKSSWFDWTSSWFDWKCSLIWLKMFLDLIESVPWFDWKCSLIWLKMFFGLLKVVFDMFECTLYFYWKSFNFASQKLLKETACVRNSNVPKLFVPYNLALTHRLLLIYQCWSLSIKKSASGCYSTCKYLSGVPQTEHGKFAISQGL